MANTILSNDLSSNEQQVLGWANIASGGAKALKPSAHHGSHTTPIGRDGEHKSGIALKSGESGSKSSSNARKPLRNMGSNSGRQKTHSNEEDLANGSSTSHLNEEQLSVDDGIEESDDNLGKKTKTRRKPFPIPTIDPLPDGKKYTTEQLIEIGEDLMTQDAFLNAQRKELYEIVFPQGYMPKPPVRKAKKNSTAVLQNTNMGYFGMPSEFSDLPHATNPAVNSGKSRFGDTFGQQQSPSQFASQPALNSTWAPLSSPGGMTGLAGIPSNSGIPSSFSPFPRKSAHPFDQNFGIGHGSPSAPPPGILPSTNTMIYPDRIMWVYKDFNGADQGPFNGVMMQGWFKDKWLPDSLMLRRVEDKEYISLNEFKAQMNNSTTPFLVPLPAAGIPLASASFSQTSAPAPVTTPGGSFMGWNNNIIQPNGWGPMKSLQQQVLTKPQSAVGTPIGTPVIGSPLLNNNAKLAESTTTPIGSPIVRSSSIFNGIKTENPTEELPVSPKIEKQVEQLISDVEEVIENTKERFEEAVEILKTDIESDDSVNTKEEAVTTETVLSDRVTETLPSAEKEEEAAVDHESEENTAFSTEEGEKSGKVKGLASLPQPAKESTTPKPLTSVVAPWAKKASSAPKSPEANLSFAEIQELESKKKQEIKAKEKAQRLAELKTRNIASSATQEKPSSPISTGLPSLSRWANDSGATSSSSIKTLAEIQREEKERAKKKAESTQRSTSSPIGLQPGPKRYAEVIAPKTPSYLRQATSHANLKASASSSAEEKQTAEEESGWTTISSNKKPPAPAPARNVHTIVNKPGATSENPAAVSLKLTGGMADFAQWCNSAIRGLNPGVNQNELLSMMISLPANSDSKDIIADIIYANSSTMDGRRFAEEFMKRRNKVENAKGDGKDWGNFLQTAPVAKPIASDNSFKVVKRKK